MKKRILIAGMVSLSCAGEVFCVGTSRDLFVHASKHHRCLLDGKDVGYACPSCSHSVFVLGKTDTDRKDQEVTVKMDCENYFPGCKICEKFCFRNDEIICGEGQRKFEGNTKSTLRGKSIKELEKLYEKKSKELNEEKLKELNVGKFEKWRGEKLKELEEWYEKKLKELDKKELKELYKKMLKELYEKKFGEWNEEIFEELYEKELKELDKKELYKKMLKELYGEKLKELYGKESKELYEKNLERLYERRLNEWYEKKLDELNEKENIGPKELRIQAFFIRGSSHIDRRHFRCFVCFKDFRGLSDQEIKDHLWHHGVCKECGYEEVKKGDKEVHLESKHGCNCFQPWSGHSDQCSSRLLRCNDHNDSYPIEHFRQQHRCKEGCEIRYDSKSGKNVIFHSCYIKCPECLKDVPGVHMDDVEGCSEGCQLVDGKWEHEGNCRHWVDCELCTDKVVCATPFHMSSVHGCKLKETGCCKKGKTWKHGESCSVIWCSECETRKVFENSGFREHVKEHGCSCKIINPSRGHEESCPCYKKQCPIGKGCVVIISDLMLLRNHVKTNHKGYDYCPFCQTWVQVDHLLRHQCRCSHRSMNEVHDRGCPCFLTCPDCKIPVAWDHRMEQHKCMKCRLMVYYPKDGTDEESKYEDDPRYRYKFWYCEGCKKKLESLEKK